MVIRTAVVTYCLYHPGKSLFVGADNSGSRNVCTSDEDFFHYTFKGNSAITAGFQQSAENRGSMLLIIMFYIIPLMILHVSFNIVAFFSQSPEHFKRPKAYYLMS